MSTIDLLFIEKTPMFTIEPLNIVKGVYFILLETEDCNNSLMGFFKTREEAFAYSEKFYFWSRTDYLSIWKLNLNTLKREFVANYSVKGFVYDQ